MIHNKFLQSIWAAFILIWLNNLSSTDSYFCIYALVAFLAFFLITRLDQHIQHENHHIMILVLSIIFSVFILFANYPIFTKIGDPERIGRATSIVVNLINSFLSFVGGICVAYPILRWWFGRKPIQNSSLFTVRNERSLSICIFLSIFLFNLIHLILVEYPGNVTEDPFTQISEMVSGNYSNFNTFWHTIFFQGILTIGFNLFSDVNAAIAFFCVIQSAIMAFAFTYSLLTMYHYGIPKALFIAFWALYGFVPYNMAMSITIWKDVLFAGGCLLLISSILRIFRCIGRYSFVHYLVFAFGSLLLILSRTNGWLILLITTFVALPAIRLKKKLMACMFVFSALGWILLNPMLSVLNVSGGDLVESLSIPIQQVSCTIADGKILTEEETELLSRVVDIEEVPKLYTDWISDPMKIELRSKDYDYFKNHFSEYVRLWVDLGLRYPDSYAKAWVEQTKGYWNGGYDYAMYSETITDNPYGIVKTRGENPVASLFRMYFGLSRHLIFFEPLHSIGLHIWILILCFILNVVNKREEWIASAPLLILVTGLWLGTPVYACFRYAYPVFVCLPLILTTALFIPRSDSLLQ